MGLKKFIETHGDSFPYPVTIVNQDLPDSPQTFVNLNFCELTGFPREEILGTNCRFLQGGKCDPLITKKIREAMSERLPFFQDLKNYKKDGELFYNRLVAIPFRIGREKFYLGLQHEIQAEKYTPFNEVPPNDLMDRTVNPLTILCSLEYVADSRLNGEFQKMIEKIQAFVLGLS